MDKEKLDTFKQIVLEKLVVSGTNIVSKSVLENIRITDFMEMPQMLELVQQIYTIILGNENAMTIEQYATWWQEIRDNRLSKSWLKKYPSKKKTIRIQASFPTMEYPKGIYHKPYVRFH